VARSLSIRAVKVATEETGPVLGLGQMEVVAPKAATKTAAGIAAGVEGAIIY
jgi:hypothetical protein